MEKPRLTLLDAFLCVALVVLVLLVFQQVSRHEFVNFDDVTYIQKNPLVEKGFSGQSVQEAFTRPWASYWIPLTWISFSIDRSLWGDWAGGYALTNAVLHLLSSILLYLFFVKATGSRLASAMVAFVFAAHPLHVESVAWVSQRKDTLAGLLWMLTLLSWYRFAARGGKWQWGALSFAFFLLGLLSKPTLVTLPVVLLLLDFWPLERFDLRRSFRWSNLGRSVLEKTPFFAGALASGVVVLYTQSSMGAREMAGVVPTSIQLLVAAESFGFYLTKFFWPQNLSPLYPLPFTPPPMTVVLSSLGTVALISFLVIRWRNRHPYWFVGWFWFLVTILPMIGIIHVGIQGRANRWMYLPMIGLLIMTAWTIERFARSPARKWITGTVIVLLTAGLGLAARAEVRIWKNTTTLFERAVEVTEDNYYAHDRLAQEYRSQGQIDKALKHYYKAIALIPFFARPQRQVAEIFARQGRSEASAVLFENADAMKWGDWSSADKTATALVRAGLDDVALPVLKSRLEANPDSAQLHSAMAVILRRRNDLAGAAHHWKQALKIEPRLYSSAGQLAWIQATSSEPELKDPGQAIATAGRALREMRSLEPFLLETMAAGFSATGQWNQAVENARQAALLYRSQGNTGLAVRAEASLRRYQAEAASVHNPETSQ